MKATYKIDTQHSTAHFVVRHLMITNVRGSFGNVQGTVVYDSDDPATSNVEAAIDAASINTNEAQRDGHLKSADFLDVEKYPTITFKSKHLKKAGDGEWNLAGDLTLHGVTKEVVLKVEGPTGETKDPYGNVRIGASATTKIKRSDFGLNFNMVMEAGGIAIGDELKIEIEVSLIKS